MTTQGSAKKNYNNHPFQGSCDGNTFALAHNGVLHNDHSLRRSLKLPTPKIETDSYIAVQLIEQQKTLNLDSLARMAEQVEGSFSFSVLDQQNRLYLVKGDNPLCLYHFPQAGIYLYASTEEILKKALKRMHLFREKPISVEIEMGDILQIEPNGRIITGHFNPQKLLHSYHYNAYSGWYYPYQTSLLDEPDPMYVEELKSIASCFGYAPSDIDHLLEQGFSCEEIEEAFYSIEL